jgi:DNA-binding response OmpR family regulator
MVYNKKNQERILAMNIKKKILIADDETVNLDFFELMLSKLGFVVEKSDNGHEVIEKVKKFHPDLIILDNIMPGMSGREITKILKNDPNLKNISIIMLSALDDVKDKVAGFEAGVDDYITKPFNFTEVLARINAVFRNRELFDQIAVRETRLVLAEELNKDLKENISAFVGSIDELDKAIALIIKNAAESGETLNQEIFINSVKPVSEKILSVRKHIAALDARIEKTINEWNNLKKDEIGLSVLESQIRKLLHQEQQ